MNIGPRLGTNQPRQTNRLYVLYRRRITRAAQRGTFSRYYIERGERFWPASRAQAGFGPGLGTRNQPAPPVRIIPPEENWCCTSGNFLEVERGERFWSLATPASHAQAGFAATALHQCLLSEPIFGEDATTDFNVRRRQVYGG